MFYRIEDIPDEQTMQAVVARLLPLVPLQRREYALRYRHLHGQYCCLRAWQLLHELLTEHAFIPSDFPLSQLTYTEDEYGKPSLIPNSLIAHRSPHFSISHTKNALAVAVSREPVGIDVEAVVSVRRAEDTPLLQRTMSAAERQVIAASADPCMTFTELWTRKEAVFKAIGTGINFETLPDVLLTDDFCVRSGHTATYAYAIASR
jgi:4'-phosphopantetheinyl transferase